MALLVAAAIAVIAFAMSVFHAAKVRGARFVSLHMNKRLLRQVFWIFDARWWVYLLLTNSKAPDVASSVSSLKHFNNVLWSLLRSLLYDEAIKLKKGIDRFSTSLASCRCFSWELVECVFQQPCRRPYVALMVVLSTSWVYYLHRAVCRPSVSGPIAGTKAEKCSSQFSF